MVYLVGRRSIINREDVDLLKYSLSTPAAATTAAGWEMDRSSESSSGDSGLPEQSVFRADHHASALLSYMKELRDKHDLCDIILNVDDQEFAVHRVVLAACSPYFSAMLTNEHRESQQRRVSLSGIDPATLESLLDFVYSSILVVTEENVQSLLAGANLLQLNLVVDACCEFLRVRLHPENCLGIASFAEMHGCVSLQEDSWQYVLHNFADIVETEEFLSIPSPYLAELVKSESLNVNSEEEVLDSVLKWFGHDQASRNSSISSILQHVKLPLIPWETLSEKMLTDMFLVSNAECQVLLMNARSFQTDPEMAEKCVSNIPENSQIVPRKSVGQSLFLYVVGGETSPGRSTVSSIERFDPAKNIWQELASMKSSRRGLGVGVLDGHLYAVGGSDGTQALRIVERYDPRLNFWARVADMNEERSSVATASLGGFLYAVGGYDGVTSCLRTVERYDPNSDTWTYVAQMNVPRSMVSVGIVQNKLFVIGGYDGGSDLSSCEVFDAELDRWTLIAEMRSCRCMAGIGVIENHLYAVGGCDCSHSLSTMEVYDHDKDEWSLVSEMAERRSGVGVAVVGRKLYAVGGYTGSNYCSSVECYDPKANAWSSVASMRVGRRRFGCCS